MTTETIEAVFEHGGFRLLQQPNIALHDGQQVRLVVETEESPETILALASTVYKGLSSEEIAEVERIALQRREFFGDAA
jgi:predicted DNA-binding antitoxin AbrB/MazE fold protein